MPRPGTPARSWRTYFQLPIENVNRLGQSASSFLGHVVLGWNQAHGAEMHRRGGSSGVLRHKMPTRMSRIRSFLRCWTRPHVGLSTPSCSLSSRAVRVGPKRRIVDQKIDLLAGRGQKTTWCRFYCTVVETHEWLAGVLDPGETLHCRSGNRRMSLLAARRQFCPCWSPRCALMLVWIVRVPLRHVFRRCLSRRWCLRRCSGCSACRRRLPPLGDSSHRLRC